jgi:hypothetical protein
MNFLSYYFDPAASGTLMPGLAVLVMTAYVAAPAIASMLLVWAEGRWPLLHRSMLVEIPAALVTTFALSVIWMGTFGSVADSYTGHEALYRTLPYVALGLVALAIVFQIYNRATFSTTRGVTIAAAVLLPIVLVAIGP